MDPIIYSAYNDDSGRCTICAADTLWGDAPHKEGCQLLVQCQICKRCIYLELGVTTVPEALELIHELQGERMLKNWAKQNSVQKPKF